MINKFVVYCAMGSLLACAKPSSQKSNRSGVDANPNPNATIDSYGESEDLNPDTTTDTEIGNSKDKQATQPAIEEMKPFDPSVRLERTPNQGTHENNFGSTVHRKSIVDMKDKISGSVSETLLYASEEAYLVAISARQNPETKAKPFPVGESSNIYYFEFKVLEDSSEISVSLGSIRQFSPSLGHQTRVSIRLRSQEADLESFEIKSLTPEAHKIDIAFSKPLVLPVGEYSLRIKSNNTELENVSITSSKKIEALGVFRTKTPVGY